MHRLIDLVLAKLSVLQHDIPSCRMGDRACVPATRTLQPWTVPAHLPLHSQVTAASTIDGRTSSLESSASDGLHTTGRRRAVGMTISIRPHCTTRMTTERCHLSRRPKKARRTKEQIDKDEEEQKVEEE